MDKAEAAKDKAKESKKKGQKNASNDTFLQTENVQMNLKNNVTCGAFSNYKWAGITDGFGKVIFRHLSIEAMEEIMRLVQATRINKCKDKSVLTTQVDAVANWMVELGMKGRRWACARGKGSQGVQVSTATSIQACKLLTSGCAGKHSN
jgi:hypothetical protein